jgi:hypothetical protein
VSLRAHPGMAVISAELRMDAAVGPPAALVATSTRKSSFCVAEAPRDPHSEPGNQGLSTLTSSGEPWRILE